MSPWSEAESPGAAGPSGSAPRRSLVHLEAYEDTGNGWVETVPMVFETEARSTTRMWTCASCYFKQGQWLPFDLQ